MCNLLTLVLLLAAPSIADSPAPTPAPKPTLTTAGEGPAAPPPKIEGPAPSAPPSEAPPSEAPPSDAPPSDAPPSDAPPSDAPPPTLSPEPAARSSIPPNPRGTGAAWSSPSASPSRPPPPAEYEYPERDLSELPYGATAARKSAVQRNNDVLVRPFSRPVYSIAASGRFGTLLTGGAEVVQPFGYGFAAQLRIHFVGVIKSRFGVEVHAGHTRFTQRKEYEGFEPGTKVTRLTVLSDTDFSAGPSLQIPLGPLFLQFGGSAGVALSTLFRPQSAEATDDEAVSTSNFMLRGGLSLGVPVLNRHGLTVGAGVHHIFSPREVAIDPQAAEPVMTRPFGTWLEILLGYQIWF